jgi:hypothetical protein
LNTPVTGQQLNAPAGQQLNIPATVQQLNTLATVELDWRIGRA